MRAADIDFYAVDTASDIPENMDVGALYFVADTGTIHINHGAKSGPVIYGGGGRINASE